MEDFTAIEILDLKKYNHYSGTLPMGPNKRWTHPDDRAARAQAPCCQRSSCRSVQQEEEGISITSDVVKMEGEDPTVKQTNSQDLWT